MFLHEIEEPAADFRQGGAFLSRRFPGGRLFSDRFGPGHERADERGDDRVKAFAPGNDLCMIDAAVPDHGNEIDVAQNARSHEEGSGYLERLLCQPPHEAGRRSFAFGKRCGGEPQRLDRHRIEKAESQIVELGRLLTGGPFQRAIGGYGGTEHALAVARPPIKRHMPEIYG